MQAKYISPTFGGSKPGNGITFKASIGNDSAYAAEVLFNDTFGTFNVEFGAGYNGADGQSGDCDAQNNQCANPEGVLNDDMHTHLVSEAVSGSIWDTHTGFLVSGEYAQALSNIPGHQDASNYFLKGGFRKNVTGMGDTTAYVDYGKYSHMLGNDTALESWALGLDQAVDSTAMNVYFHFQEDKWDGGTTASGDVIPKQHVDYAIVGAKISF